MKKIIIFLIALSTIQFIHITNTSAQTFYPAEYIPEIWLNKYNPKDNLIYYHQAQFIKTTNTNQIAYCLEPFTELTSQDSYNQINKETKYTQEQQKTITLLAHFGYGYQNHTDPKWYAVTQILIWKVAYPNAKYYYTSSPNGKKISFQSEEEEIYRLLTEYTKNTSFNQQTYTNVANNKLIITDNNQVLNTFKTISNIATITNNQLHISPLTKGTYEVNLEKESIIHNEPVIFYLSPTNQDVVKLGDPQININKLTINIIETTLTINKLDHDTNLQQSEASLAGAIFALYTTDNQLVQKITIDNTLSATIKNLNFGTYYIEEQTPGTGYLLNKKKYYFQLNENTPTQEINIPNKIITGTLKIKKEYGTTNNFKPEPNISFNIYNYNNELIKTIVTNEQGIAEINLPYGNYHLTQLTTTEGYQKIEPIIFTIDQHEQIIETNLKNYKIAVPNTSTKSFITKIIEFIKRFIWQKK